MLTNKNMTRKHVNENMKVWPEKITLLDDASMLTKKTKKTMIETEIVAWGKVEE